MIICRKVWFQHISYIAPEAQRHISDRRFDHRVTGSSRTVTCALEIGLKCAFNSEHCITRTTETKKLMNASVRNFVSSLLQNQTCQKL